ncbi:MAG: putative peptidyl-prolyl cis-trans isomerase [Pelotomaculum sp. PtaU1.Bin035]|nr:MAG: putative peptidyl-prolyl cis-trans isomerase [Pelotomaculum sp. PtaU1.Bin035]
MKKSVIILMLIAAVIILPGIYPAAAAIDLGKADYNIDVFVNGNQVGFSDQRPFIDTTIGRTYVPLRFVSEALGSGIEWNEEFQKVTIFKDGLLICLEIGSNMAFVDDHGIQRVIFIDPPELINERTMVPLRFISEILGADVKYTFPAEGEKGRIDVDEKTASLTDNEDSQVVTIETSKGQIILEVYPKMMPITVGNFDKLIKSNFYDGLTFHRVEDWVIQGGDPKGNGTGGPGWTIPLEINPTLKNTRGALAMARSSNPNSAGSQFYILKKDASWLDGQYAVFGNVIEGMDVVDKIEVGDKMISVN